MVSGWPVTQSRVIVALNVPPSLTGGIERNAEARFLNIQDVHSLVGRDVAGRRGADGDLLFTSDNAVIVWRKIKRNGILVGRNNDGSRNTKVARERTGECDAQRRGRIAAACDGGMLNGGVFGETGRDGERQ